MKIFVNGHLTSATIKLDMTNIISLAKELNIWLQNNYFLAFYQKLCTSEKILRVLGNPIKFLLNGKLGSRVNHKTMTLLN